MKLSDVKTESEIYDISDCWHKRAKSMIKIINNKNESKERIDKAFRIWKHYGNLVIHMTQIVNQVRIMKLKNYQPGAKITPIVNLPILTDGREIIMDKYGNIVKY